MKSISRLVLGTAQLGMPYGIANKSGKPDHSTALAIVREAIEAGIEEFDTAQGYGESESILGRCLNLLGVCKNVKIITKIDPSINHLDPKAMSNALDQSLGRLKVSSLSGLMLHREGQVDNWNRGLGDILSGFLEDGRVERVGVSVYSPRKALKALDIEGIQLLQAPTSILDRRFIEAAVFDAAVQSRKQVYVRSAFLQGLILLDPNDLRENMGYARPALERIGYLSQKTQLTRKEMALVYLREKCSAAQIIFGAESPNQVKENVSCWMKNAPDGFLDQVELALPLEDEKILNPNLWPS